MTLTKAFRDRGVTQEDVTRWIEEMRRDLPPGSTVYTTVKHVARSGMSRSIDVHTIEDNEPRWMSYRVAAILGESFDEQRESVRVYGAGMDMGFQLVYNLSSVLYPRGFGCIGKDCPSNDHSNSDRDYTPHTLSGMTGKGEDVVAIGLAQEQDNGPKAGGYWHWHRSGGYALRQRWM
jgi:hypothetical protein